MSWYEGIDLDSLGSIRAGSEYYTDDATKKRLKEAACKILDFADVHSEFFKDVEAEESDEEDAGNDGGNAASEETGGDPNELLISDAHRQGTPASDPATTSGPAGAPAN